MPPPTGPPLTFRAPGTPGAPPVKKQRATGTPKRDPMLASADEGIARRRAVLQRLQQQREGQLATQSTGMTTDALLSKAASRLGTRPSGPPKQRPAVPPPKDIGLKRTSDIFPTAPKVTEPRRQLDAAFSRSKSAPPSRPPPPPPPPPPVDDNTAATPPIISPPKKLSGRTSPFHFAPEETTVEVIDEASVDTPSPPKQDTGRTPFPGKTNHNLRNAGHTPFVQTTLVEETPPAAKMNAGHTPFPATDETTPAVARTLHLDEDTPKIDNRSPALQWQERVLALEKEKKDLLLETAEKNRQLTQLMSSRASGTASSSDLLTLLDMADVQGETAALNWAREHVQTKTVGFLSPMAGLSSRPAGTPQRKRVSPPKPQRATSHDDMDAIREAVQVVQHVYETDDAIFVVRKPFGLADEHDLWFAAGQSSAKPYMKQADILDYRTLEVAATVKADGSVFVVYGEGIARHQLPDDGTWKEFGNVSKRELSLGSVTYIDSDANEQEYSLDEIYDGADSVRFTYCAAILSTSDGLKHRQRQPLSESRAPPPMMAAPSANGMVPHPSPKSEVSTQTDAATESIQPVVAPNPSTQQVVPTPAPTKNVARVVEAPDIASAVSALFFNGVLSLLWSIIMIPVRVFVSAFYLVVAIFLVSFFKMYFDDNAGAVAGFNRPGIV